MKYNVMGINIKRVIPRLFNLTPKSRGLIVPLTYTFIVTAKKGKMIQEMPKISELNNEGWILILRVLP